MAASDGRRARPPQEPRSRARCWLTPQRPGPSIHETTTCHRSDHGGDRRCSARRRLDAGGVGIGLRRRHRRPLRCRNAGGRHGRGRRRLGAAEAGDRGLRWYDPPRGPGRHTVVASERDGERGRRRARRRRRARPGGDDLRARRGARVQRDLLGRAGRARRLRRDARGRALGDHQHRGRRRVGRQHSRGAGSDDDLRPDLGPRPCRREQLPHRVVGHRGQVLRVRGRRRASGRVAARGDHEPDAPDRERLHGRRPRGERSTRSP